MSQSAENNGAWKGYNLYEKPFNTTCINPSYFLLFLFYIAHTTCIFVVLRTCKDNRERVSENREPASVGSLLCLLTSTISSVLGQIVLVVLLQVLLLQRQHWDTPLPRMLE